MKDIELVIKIPEEKHNMIKSKMYCGIYDAEVYEAISNGTPLPKGHGKIIDADKIEWYGCMSEEYCPHKNTECKDCVRAECDKRQVDAITAIVEADGGVE